MKTLLSAILAVLLAVSPVQAAFTFNGVDQDLVVTGSSAMNLVSPHSFGGWFKVTDNAGTSTEYLLATDASTGTNPMHAVFCAETSHATLPGKLGVRINDDDTTDTVLTTTDAICDSTSWQHFLFVDDGTNLRIYINNAQQASVSKGATGNSSDSGNLTFGHLEASETTRWDGSLCDWAKWDKALNDGERNGLAIGWAARFYLISMAWYLEMIRNYQDIKGSHAVTNNGTTVTDCPPLFRPGGSPQTY